MATERDFRLQPRSDELSTVVCNHCESNVGEVYVAQQAPTGRTTGRDQAEITVEARQIVDEHRLKCDQRRIIAAFRYDAPHPSVRGTSTLLTHALLSAHYEPM